VSGPALGDACVAVPGYEGFRSKLRTVVEARDGAAFRALFHPDGAMRVEGVGGRSATPDWGFGRPGAERVWQVLGDILKLGCAVEGERLVMPAMALLFADLEPDHLIVLQDTPIRRGPSEASPILHNAVRGKIVAFTAFDSPAGWTQILFGKSTAYVPTPAVRSPLSYRLELTRFEGQWRIREFGSGV